MREGRRSPAPGENGHELWRVKRWRCEDEHEREDGHEDGHGHDEAYEDAHDYDYEDGNL